MKALFNLLERIHISSAFRTAEKQEAITVWNRGLVWDDALVKQAALDAETKKPMMSIVVPGGMSQRGLHDGGHLSLYRAFDRDKVAVHFSDMLENSGIDQFTKHGTEFYKQWGHIENKSFWRAAGAYLNQTQGLDMWGFAFDEAAYCGNVLPFQECDDTVLRYRAGNLSQRSTGGWKAKMLHPTAAKWLVNAGLWSRADMATQVNPKTCPMDGNGFMGLPVGSVCESRYVVDMCEDVLRDYGLSLDQKVRFVGQALLSLGLNYWDEQLSVRLAPYTADIEIDALKAVCGCMVFVQDTGEQCLYNTLQRGTQAASLKFSAEHANTGMREGPYQHEGLLFLMDLNPPEDRAALYHLGAMALRVHRRQVQEPEVVVLPSLE